MLLNASDIVYCRLRYGIIQYNNQYKHIPSSFQNCARVCSSVWLKRMGTTTAPAPESHATYEESTRE